MKKIVLIALFAICCGLFMTAQNNVKIDVSLQQEMSLRDAGDLIRINIIMNQQYDQMDMRMKSSVFPTKAAKRAFVIGELKRFSEETQQGVMELLSSMPLVADVQSFWIANFIGCYANIETIEALSLHPDVMLIGFDKEENLIPEGETSTPADLTREITYNVTKVNANQVWALGYEGEGIVVAVLDSGVNYNHLDLAGHLWEHPDYPNHGWNFVANSNNPMDDHGHGSHCAGTVAGNGTAGSQTGMAPKARIMAVKVLNNQGSGTLEQATGGLQFAVEKGADVLSMSWGWAGGGDASVRIPLRNAMINVLEAGVVASVAAGNDGSFPGSWLYPVPNNVGCPGNCPPPWLHPDQTTIGGTSAVVCVGATNSSDAIANFSSRGPVTWQAIAGFNDYPYNPGMGLIRPDVSAPGVNIKSLTHNSNSGYTTMDGTSMATPCVAGVMALLLSKNPNLTPAQICEILETTAVHLPNSASPKNNNYGSGRINALEAINVVPEPTGKIVFENLVINDTDGNNSGKLNPSETVHLTVSMKNDSNQPINDVHVTFNTANTLVTIVNGDANYGDFVAHEIKTVENAFTITLSEDAVNGDDITAILEATFESITTQSTIHLTVCDYILELMDIKLPEGTTSIKPGDTSNILIFLKNIGSDLAANLSAELTTSVPYLIINESIACYGQLSPEEYKDKIFNITISPYTPSGITEVPVTLTVTDEFGRKTVLNGIIPIDEIMPCDVTIELTLGGEGGEILLSWLPVLENTKFRIYRNGELLVEVEENSFIDYDIECFKIYCYTVTAVCGTDMETEHSNEECGGYIGINELQNDIKIYPNPANATLSVAGTGLKTVSIYNMLGQMIETVETNGKTVTTINTSSYQSAMYFVEIVLENGNKINKQLIISR